MTKEKMIKVFCDKCNGKGFYYEYGHSGETEYYHECDKCNSTGYIYVTKMASEHFIKYKGIK